MSPAKYEDFARQIAEAGFFTNGWSDCQTWARTCVCSKRRDGGGYTGNSFWVTVIGNRWYFGTWGGWFYQLPDADRAVELCIDWLTHNPSQTLGNFNAAFIQRFGLIPVSQTQFYELAKIDNE